MQIAEIVAANARLVRTQRHLSLEGAAAKTGVSKSMLGQIERAEVNATVAVLARMAEGYCVPLTRLLEIPRQPVTVIPNRTLARERLGDGDAYRYAIVREDSLELERLEILPGGKVTRELPADCKTAYATVYRGIAVLETARDQNPVTLNRWDTLCLRGGGRYTVRNDGEQMVQLQLVLRYD